MTRINVVPVEELYDQHLIAEYREIPRISSSLRATLGSYKVVNNGGKLLPNKIPRYYKLGKGHVYFFYDKGLYLEKRYISLIQEMLKRGFKPTATDPYPSQIFKDRDLYNDWAPDQAALTVNRERLQEKLDAKPNWYRKTKYD